MFNRIHEDFAVISYIFPSTGTTNNRGDGNENNV